MATAETYNTCGAAPTTSGPLSERLLRHFRRITAARELRALSPAQLRDMGIDPALVHGGPACETDPRTMIRLMSMR